MRDGRPLRRPGRPRMIGGVPDPSPDRRSPAWAWYAAAAAILVALGALDLLGVLDGLGP